MLAAVLHLSTAMPKPSAAALKPAAQMDATLVTKLNSGGWKGPTVTELESEAPFEGGGWKCPADRPYAYGGGVHCCSEEVDFQAESCTGTTSRCPSGQTRTKMDMCSPIPSTGSSGCAGWCDNHTTAWEYKCFWSAGVCSACDECTGLAAPTGPRCEPWCAGHTNDWTTKCSWKSEECSTCGGCIAPSFPPSPYTPPVPSTPPPPLAPSPSPPPPWEYSSAICRSQHHADLFFKNPHLDDCPVGNSGLLMCSQATTVGTLCYYSVGSSCGAAAEAPLQPYSCCVAGNKDATCNGGNVILQVAIPPSSPPPPPPPPFTPPPASFWGAKDYTSMRQNAGRGGTNMIAKSWTSPNSCQSSNPTYNNVAVYYMNFGAIPWVQCMQLAAEYKMQVAAEGGTGNLYPAWSSVVGNDGASAFAYSGNWPSPSLYHLDNNLYCVLEMYKGGIMDEGPYFRDGTPYTVQTAQVTRQLGSLHQCLHFKYAYLGATTSYMCQWHAASNGASVLPSSTLGLGNIVTAMPTFFSCNTNWWWAGTYPTYISAGGGDEGTAHACYIGYLDHLC